MEKSLARDIWSVLAHHGLHLSRKESHLIQHVKWFDEVPLAKKNYPMWGTEKKDGNNNILVTLAGRCYCFSRKGKRFTNCDLIEQKYEALNLPDGFYLSEIENPHEPRHIMGGWITPTRVDPLEKEAEESHSWTDLWFFDFLSVAEFMKGRAITQYVDRHTRLFRSNLPKDRLLGRQRLDSEEEFNTYADAVIKSGGEGIVGHQECDYVAGHKGFRCMKKVQKKTFDLKLVQVFDGKGKNVGLASTFVLEDTKGARINAGAGLGWNAGKCLDAYQNQEKYLGKIYEVYSFEMLPSGALRQPKIGDERHDKIGVDSYGTEQGNTAKE